MNVVALLAVASFTLFVATAFLLYRATRRLLEFDDLWNFIMPELIEYEADLKSMASGDLLIDHPEVEAFHKRNLKALQVVSRAVKSIIESRPKVAEKPKLPRPEVE